MKIRERLTSLGLVAVMATGVITGGTAVFADETEPTLIATDGTTESTSEATSGTEPTGTTQEAIDLSTYTFEKVYGSQLASYLDHQYTFNGKEIPLAESNFYIVNAFVELTQYYGYYYGTSEGFLDLAAAYFEPDKYATFGDFMISYAERTLESSCIICERASNEGVLLSDETRAQIDEMMTTLTSNAQKSNVTLDQYLKLYYGKSCDEASFRAVLENYYLADLYSLKYCETHITDEMKRVPNIRYALFEAAEGTADDQAKKTSEDLANDLVKQAAGDLTKLKELAEQSYADGVCKQTYDISVRKGQTVSAFEEWAYDTARKEGDIGVIYAPEYGYFVVGYLGLIDLSTEDLESDLVQMLSDEIGKEIESGKYQFGTTQAYEPAKVITAAPTQAADPVDPTDPAVTGVPAETTSDLNPDGTPKDSGVKTVALLIALVVGGVALIAVIIILTAFALKKIHGGNNDARKSESYSWDRDDDEDDDDNESIVAGAKLGLSAIEENDTEADEEDSDEDDSDGDEKKDEE